LLEEQQAFFQQLIKSVGTMVALPQFPCRF
jgi:hypothetical protein